VHVILVSTGMVDIPPLRGGAVEWYVYDLAQMLASRPGLSVSLVSDLRGLDPGGMPRGIQAVRTYSPVDRFPLATGASVSAHLVGGWSAAWATVRHLHNGGGHDPATVLHLNEEVSAMALARSRPRVPKVFTIHNPPPELSTFSYSRREGWIRSLNARASERFFLRKMDRVIALSTSVGRYLVEEAGVEPARVVVLPLPINTDLWTPAPRDAGGPPEILYVGRLDRRKNVAGLLRAMDGLNSGSRLTLVGAGPMQGSIEEWLRGREPQDRVRLLSDVPSPALLEIYQRSSFLVLPSLLETYPRVVIEAAACGLPVILPNLPLYQDFLDGGFVWSFDPSEPGSLAARIDELAHDPALAVCLGRRAREFAVRSNGYAAYLDRLEGLYLSLVG
jgi:glycosyltransferase involved in cell wall biosynthesis